MTRSPRPRRPSRAAADRSIGAPEAPNGVVVVHASVRGRSRVRVRALHRDPVLAARLAEALDRRSGIRHVTASALTGTVLVEHDLAYDAAEIAVLVAGVTRRLQRATPAAIHPAARLDAREAERGCATSATAQLARAVRAVRGRPVREPPREPPPLDVVRRGADSAAAGVAPPPTAADGDRAPLVEMRRARWHLEHPDAAAAHFGVRLERGLDARAVESARARFGPNELPKPVEWSPWQAVAGQLTSLPVLLLLGSATISVATGGVADALVIGGVVVINAAIGYFTEAQAERTIASLAGSEAHVAEVIRDGALHRVGVAEVVPGDVFVLRAGMNVPADGRLVEAEHLMVDESSLTGESVPVLKSVAALLDPDAALADLTNLVHRGTVVIGGSGTAIAVATGAGTEIGRIQHLVSEARQPETPLQRQLRVLGGQMVGVSGAICAAVFGIGLLRGQSLLAMLKTSVSLAVAAVPEGLPTVATTTLARGLQRMARQRVLIRRLSAVETLGALEVICLDKTGTITVNRMRVVAAVADRARLDLTSADASSRAAGGSAWERLLRVVTLCNDATLAGTPGAWLLDGSPTESALVEAALERGLDVEEVRRTHPRRAARYRSEARNFMVTLHDLPGGSRSLVAVKGSPVEVLALCRSELRGGRAVKLDRGAIAEIEAENARLAGRALRVLGVAYAEVDAREGIPDPLPELVWLGLTGMTDPPREGMRTLMSRFHAAGIQTIMITGDQSATAAAVAREVGIPHADRLEILDALRIDEMDPVVLAALARRADVFSRVSPSHKLRIVQALQRAGRVVAMTGDGINDGPALRAADIGIAMGMSGTDVAREIADVVIGDDELGTVMEAIEHGRAIYDDIRRAVHFILATNLSEMGVTLAATAAGLGEPLNPMQLLWINLVTDIFPELALAVQPPEDDVLRRPPRPADRPMFAGTDLARLGAEGAVLSASAMAAYGWALARGGAGPRASTVAFTTLTCGQLLQALGLESDRHPVFDRSQVRGNPYVALAVGGGILAQILGTALPGLRRLLGTVPLGVGEWLVCGAGAVAPLVVTEVAKAVRNGRDRAVPDQVFGATESLA